MLWIRKMPVMQRPISQELCQQPWQKCSTLDGLIPGSKPFASGQEGRLASICVYVKAVNSSGVRVLRLLDQSCRIGLSDTGGGGCMASAAGDLDAVSVIECASASGTG